jgi:multisubunit Na+/H+ antiporter MnhB subunit
MTSREAMTSVILRFTARLLLIPIGLVSVWMLWRGHDLPGGGFIAGLVAGAGMGLWFLAFGIDGMHRLIRIRGSILIGIGLTVAALTGFVMLAAGRGFLGTAIWRFEIPVIGAQKLTASLAFDAGVYLLVIGLITTLLEVFGQREQDRRGA